MIKMIKTINIKYLLLLSLLHFLHDIIVGFFNFIFVSKVLLLSETMLSLVLLVSEQRLPRVLFQKLKEILIKNWVLFCWMNSILFLGWEQWLLLLVEGPNLAMLMVVLDHHILFHQFIKIGNVRINLLCHSCSIQWKIIFKRFLTIQRYHVSYGKVWRRYTVIKTMQLEFFNLKRILPLFIKIINHIFNTLGCLNIRGMNLLYIILILLMM